MPEEQKRHTLPTLVNDGQGPTAWAERDWPGEARGGMVLTPRIGCSSLRLRQSEPGYAADWHVAGDPTLIIVRRGVIRLTLRDGSTRDFGPGDAFIAADRLRDGVAFNDELHGHRAEVIGDEPLEAVHIKLATG